MIKYDYLLIDIAVGSFMSGHALVFRSRPVIQLTFMSRNEDKLIDPEVDGAFVEWKVCPSFESKLSIPEICKRQNLTIAMLNL